MSLSSFLLTSGPSEAASKAKANAAIDSDLDALFASTKVAAPPTKPTPVVNVSTASASTEKKRKHPATIDTDPQDPPRHSSKKSKNSKLSKLTTETTEITPAKSSNSKRNSSESKKSKSKPKDVERRAKKARLDDSEEEGDENDAGLEDAYVRDRVAKEVKKAKKSKEKKEKKDQDRVADETRQDVNMDAAASTSSTLSSEDGNDDLSKLVHESVSSPPATSKRAKKGKGKKVKYVPEEETAEQRNERTIFVGNVSIEVAKSKSSLKSLKRHILSHLPLKAQPHAKIESTRIRSVPFSLPTASSTSTSVPAPTSNPNLIPTNEHARDRAASWRASHPEGQGKGRDKAEEIAGEESNKKKTTHEKKRVAFIKGDIHQEADSVHVYVVFAHQRPRPSNEEKNEDEGISPYEVAPLAVQHCNATILMGRTIRVDLASTSSTSGAAKAKSVEGVGADPKRTVFVGNLDFASKEEDLRAYFEGVIKGERGMPGGGEDEAEDDEEVEEDEDEDKQEADEEEGDAEYSDKEDEREEDFVEAKDVSSTKTAQPEERKAQSWVTSVRIVRDRDTQLGKGFAYVQFADRECVDEILALAQEEGKLKFAKRKLRVQRCKTIPGVKLSTTNARAQTRSSKPTTTTQNPRSHPTPTSRPPRSKPTTPVVVPKGDPALGTKLAGLSKEARKAAKAQDQDRLARRLAKKKAKGEMESQMRKKGANGKGEVKERNRDRTKAKAKGKVAGAKGAKGRVRSERSVMKRNEKK